MLSEQFSSIDRYREACLHLLTLSLVGIIGRLGSFSQVTPRARVIESVAYPRAELQLTLNEYLWRAGRRKLRRSLS